MPPTLTLPALGVSRPAMQRSSVLLPQPLGPSTLTNSPGAIERVDLLDRHDALAAELLAQPAHFDRRGRAWLHRLAIFAISARSSMSLV